MGDNDAEIVCFLTIMMMLSLPGSLIDLYNVFSDG